MLIGKFLQTHGLKGGIKLHSYCDNPLDILNMKLLTISGEEIHCEKIANTSKNNIFIVLINNISTIEDVKKYVNVEVFVDKNDLDNLDNNEFYIDELINMKIISENRIGKVENFYNYGGGDTLEVLWEDGRIESIPFTEDYIKNVDKENNTINIKKIEYI